MLLIFTDNDYLHQRDTITNAAMYGAVENILQLSFSSYH